MYNNNKSRNGGKNFRPVTEPDEVQLIVTKLLMDQLDQYKSDLDIPSSQSEQCRKRNKELFNLGTKKHIMDDLVAYQVKRSAQFDFETGAIKRVAVAFIIRDDKNLSIKYYCEGYLNDRLGGAIMITPIQDDIPNQNSNGSFHPITRERYRINIKPEF